DHFLSLDPISLGVDLLEQHLLAAETSAVAVGAARGTPRPPFFEGCSPSPLAPSYASAAAADVYVAEDVGAASASQKRRNSKGKGGSGGGGGGSGSGGGGSSGGGGGSGGGSSGGTCGGSRGSGGRGGGSRGSGGSGGGGTGGGRTGPRRGGPGGGQRQQRRSETQSPQQLRESLFQHRTSGGTDSCPYVIRTGVRARQTCGKLHTQHHCFSRLDDAWRAEFGHDVELPRWADLLRSRIDFFDLDFDAILFAMYALFVSVEGGNYRCVPPDPGIAAAALGASESGSLVFFCTVPAEDLHTFTTAALQDAMVTTTTPGGKRVSICTCTRMECHQATFTRRPGSSLYTLATETPHVAASAQVSASGQVASSCSYRLESHHTLLRHHRLGHPSLPRLRGMHSRLLVSGLPRSVLPLPPSPAPPCLPCVEGRQRAAPHSSFPPTTAPLHTLHMDVWGPARVTGQGRERYFLLVVDDYMRYTTIFPLHSKGEVVDVLIPWIRTVRLQLRERFGTDLLVLHLHSDRGGEFSSDLLREFCRGEGILLLFTLPDSPQQNGIAERRIGLVMEVARTSMIHAAAPHFLWPFAVRYAAHQLNLLHFVSLPETSLTLRWTGEVGDASVFQVLGSRAFVRDTSADKLSARAIPCVFLGFVPDAPGWQFYHPTSRRVLPSQDVTFEESVPFYRLFPYHSAPPSPPPLFLAPGPPLLDPLPPQGPAPSGVSQVDPLRGTAPVEVALGSGAARGAASGGTASRGAEFEVPGSGGAELTVLELVLELVVLEVLRLLVLEVLVPGVLELPGLVVLGALELETQRSQELLELEALALVERALEALELEELELEALAREALELQELEVLTLELEVLEALCVRDPSPLPAPSPYTEHSGGLTERREPVSRPVSPVRIAHRVPRSRPPPVPGTHTMAIRHSSVPLRVPLPAPPESSLHEVPDPEPFFESAAASALVAELLEFAVAWCLDCATALVVESASASPPSVGGECALGTDVLEERQEDFECLAAAVPRFASMLLAREGDPDAPDIPTPRSYVEAITGPYSSQWQAAMDAEMASSKSTGTYVDEVPPPGANIVDGMWIFRVKRPSGSAPSFKACYVARGFSQRQGVDYFQTFSPTPKMTTLRVLLHVAAQRDY
ncbi:unnamed protein product, partial [Closterium sp. NIES-53]